MKKISKITSPLLVLLLLCICLYSCVEKDLPDCATIPGETVLLEDGQPAYAADAETYGGEMAAYYFAWRNNGNPDYFENTVPYENGTDITLTLNPTVFSIGRDTGWSIDMNTALPKNQIGEWSHLINLDKLVDGKWERQGILWDEQMYVGFSDAIAYSYNLWEVGYPTGDAAFAEAFGYRELYAKAEDIYPTLTPGQYRFLFFVTVKQDGNTENRVYYIPFEVVE